MNNFFFNQIKIAGISEKKKNKKIRPVASSGLIGRGSIKSGQRRK